MLLYNFLIRLSLSNLRHDTLTNNVMELKSFLLFPTSIRSLSHLSKLASLKIIINDMDTSLDENTCQIIVETTPIFVHFGISIPGKMGLPDAADVEPPIVDYGILYDLSLLILFYKNYPTTIGKIHHHILSLSFHMRSLIFAEEGDCGLTL
ncbi:hypothetical protein I4U23_029535 [Adineta vaga]|nr:hypothetical protein I4U23_029535 [Adineta vaga]